MNKKVSIAIFSIAIVMMLSMLMAVLPTASADVVAITIDGDMSDWAGIAPLATDPSPDTAAWSSNGATGVGTTAESAGQIPLADQARDLRAFYGCFQSGWLYFRLDVASLALPNLLTTYNHVPAPQPYSNFTAYDLLFDLGPANPPPPPPAPYGWDVDPYPDVVDVSAVSQPWEFFIQLALFGVNPYVAAAQPPYASGWFPVIQPGAPGTIDPTQVQVGWDLVGGSVEFAINRTSVEALYGPLTIENLMIYSWKPGEPTGGYGNFPHAFDPQVPGTPGEPYGNPGGGAFGSDIADYFEVMGTIGGIGWEPWVGFLGPCWSLDMSRPTVGGFVSPIDKLALLAPWIALAAIVATVSVVVYKKKIKPF